MIALFIALGALILLLLLWLFLIAPHPRKKDVAPFLRPYAHRGLWDRDVPENSLTAFRRAAEAGFAIELDIQLSADGEVMVFHDATLTRMCGREEKIASLTAAELGATRLANTDETIPTLHAVLDAVAGRVPLLIELKGESGDTALCPRAAQVLADYRGAWCVESFNPLLVRVFKKCCKKAVCGLLVTDLIKEKRAGSKLLNFALSAELLNVLCRPAFIAWDHKYPRSLARRVALALGAASFVYTIKGEAEFDAQRAAGNTPIFDSFLPSAK